MVLLAVAAATTTALALAGPDPRPTAPPFDPRRPLARELETRIADGFTLAAVGDLIVSRPLSALLPKDPGFASVVEILRGADAAFGNFENVVLDPRTFRGYPYAGKDDWGLSAPPEVAGDLRSLGFDFVSRANNHALDWGIEGMRESSRLLDLAGIVHAGVGESRAESRLPRYLETPLGRVALVSMASTFRDYSDALPPRGAAPGRPGLSPVHVTRTVRVTPETMKALRGVRDAVEAPGEKCETTERARTRREAARRDESSLELSGTRYTVGTPVGDHWEMRALDRDEILDAIRLGKQRSDLLVAAIHVHELGPGCATPPDFLPLLARAAIDAGAGVFVASGEHRLMPVEIYKGRPIFYGLANFFWDDLQGPLPADMYEDNRARVEAAFPDSARVNDAELTALMNSEGFDDPRVFETIVAVVRWTGGRVSEVRLVPVDLGYGEPLTRSGVPRRPGPEKSREILARLQRISKPFGTEIAVEDGVGVIRPR
jgi:poly-gamma-glutamate capsule biosynthesis protein CapA/YwtB (metallophosphatase superfamily)